MTAPGEWPPPGLPPPRAGLGGCLVALLVLIGIVLVLPGICSLVFMIPLLLGRSSPGGWGLVWLITFLIAAGGIALIRYAVKNR
jgi:hypothetical protein